MLDLIASTLCFKEIEIIYRYLLFSCGSLFFIIPVWGLYLSYFKIEKIRKNLKCSWRIISQDEYIGWDPISRAWAIRDVIGAFAFPDQSIKLGLLSAEDYAEFPRKLKVVLRGLGVCSVASLLGVLLLLIIGDVVGWMDVDWFR
ncbi:hypothetical protein [Pseudomonas sp. SDO5271_S396]